MIDNIIQSVTEKLSSLPYIEGIVLGGSRARGTHTEDSDIDIGIYYKSESFDITAINQIATELDDENRNWRVCYRVRRTRSDSGQSDSSCRRFSRTLL